MVDEVDRLDKAFEWVVLFLTLSYGTVFQFLTWFLKFEYLTNLFWAIRALFIPLVLIVFLWLGKIVSVGLRRMFFRKVAWSWGMFQFGLCVWVAILLATMDTRGVGSPIEPLFPRMAFVFSCIFVPLWVFLLYRSIMKMYENATSEDVFWKSKRWNYGATTVAVGSIVLFLILLVLSPPLTS